MLVDQHSHTREFSFDGKQTAAELLDAAAQKGLAGICLTDHYDRHVAYIDNKEAIFDLAEYYFFCQEIKARQKANQPRFLLGIELGYLDHLSEEFARLALRYPFDSIILSVHVLDGLDPYHQKEIYQQGKEMAYGRYLAQLEHMITACPDFDIIGHYDYISRYAPWSDKRFNWSDLPDHFDQLFLSMITRGKALELNTATISKLGQSGLADAWPDPAIFRRYRELGGELVCLSSDAHTSQVVGHLLPEAAQWLKEQGFRYVTHFVNRQPVQTRLD